MVRVTTPTTITRTRRNTREEISIEEGHEIIQISDIREEDSINNNDINNNDIINNDFKTEEDSSSNENQERWIR